MRGIVICKTNMDEFAMGSASDTCFKGEVINPWTDDFSKPLTHWRFLKDLQQ